VNGILEFGPPKTAAGRRTIGIPAFVARSLAVHIGLYALPGDDGLVFPSADGDPMRLVNALKCKQLLPSILSTCPQS
jgi:hypothetical protein